jgi:hypothetical protein
MKKTCVVALMLLVVGLVMTDLPGYAEAPKDKSDAGRLLTGRVINGQDDPLPSAVVYLTNTRTRAVKTYIVGADGSYRFPSLSPNIDYEVYAQHNGHKSDTKTVSQFENRTQLNINLRIDAK